jgi:hypothetical protein
VGARACGWPGPTGWAPSRTAHAWQDMAATRSNGATTEIQLHAVRPCTALAGTGRLSVIDARSARRFFANAVIGRLLDDEQRCNFL